MAEDLPICRMEVISPFDVLIGGVATPLDPGIYEVGQACDGLMAPGAMVGFEAASDWIVTVGIDGVTTQDDIDEAERDGRVRWL